LLIPYLGHTQKKDSITISKEFYNIIATAPVYLTECEELRKLDSIQLIVKENEINNLTYENIQLKGDVKRFKANVIKFSIYSAFVGVITTIFVMR
jgi:hypothetical protein